MWFFAGLIIIIDVLMHQSTYTPDQQTIQAL